MVNKSVQATLYSAPDPRRWAALCRLRVDEGSGRLTKASSTDRAPMHAHGDFRRPPARGDMANTHKHALEVYKARSDVVRSLVQRSGGDNVAPAALSNKPRRTLVQFWDDLCGLPRDVCECIETWRRLEEQGFQFLLFDDRRARDFISDGLGSRYAEAYDRCYHPAMRSDYFRLCYIFREGGCYVDADDVHQGPRIDHLFIDGRLRIHPLCYDFSTDQMVPLSVFTKPGANASSWLFYFANSPLIAAHGHPIVERALANATKALERAASDELPEIQSTTGPGNLTTAVFDFVLEHGATERALVVLQDWEKIAVSKWSLSYRNDSRNWRLSNQREYGPCIGEDG